MDHAVRYRMDNEPSIAQGREEDQRPEPERPTDESPLTLLEPEEMGGEPPCYAHLLDEEGNLGEDTSQSP